MAELGLLKLRMANFGTEESRTAGLRFIPVTTDVFITTYPKCGTTWVSFICHCLRTRGDDNFEEITEVIPWTIVAKDCGQDLNAPQVATPRLFKSHEAYNLIPKGGKYIYCVRNPLDVAMSFYEFIVGYFQVFANLHIAYLIQIVTSKHIL